MGLFEIGFIAFMLLMWYIFGYKQVILGIIAFIFLINFFNNDNTDEERLKALKKENIILKSDNDKLNKTILKSDNDKRHNIRKKHRIDPVENTDREKHKLYKKVFN